MRKVLVQEENGDLAFIDADKVLEDTPTNPGPNPNPNPNILFEDNFTELSVEDGQAPSTGKRYVDSFARWGVRRLANAPNHDVGVKIFDPGNTHKIDSRGLTICGYPDKKSSTGYTCGMISTERSFSFTYGLVEIWASFPVLSSAIHNSLWLMPANGNGVPEFDILEVISNNQNGPVNALFQNAKNAQVGAWNQRNVPRGFLQEIHKYGFLWEPNKLTWFLDDEVIHTAANLYNEPMYFMATIEMGPSANGQFPGNFQPNSVWPAEMLIKRLLITKP